MNIYNSFDRDSEDLSYDGLAMTEMFERACKFYFFKAQYVNRRCNRVANCLASLARDLNSEEWRKSAPTCILYALAYVGTVAMEEVASSRVGKLK